MTDTVNVPLKATPEMVKAGLQAEQNNYSGFLREAWPLMLAAAPKAEPVGMAALDRLFYGGKAYIGAEEAVRQIVGLQAELAALRAQPEAPKVEQEPVAWLLVNGNANSEVITREHPGEWPNAHVYPLYRHPAPASDARVISYEEAHATAVEIGYASLTEALEDLESLQKDRDAFDGLGDSAPASDELLEALEAWAVEMTAKHGNPNGTDYEQGQNDMGVRVVSYLRSFRAKHKGPQS